jgi:hypothetical protein
LTDPLQNAEFVVMAEVAKEAPTIVLNSTDSTMNAKVLPFLGRADTRALFACMHFDNLLLLATGVRGQYIAIRTECEELYFRVSGNSDSWISGWTMISSWTGDGELDWCVIVKLKTQTQAMELGILFRTGLMAMRKLLDWVDPNDPSKKPVRRGAVIAFVYTLLQEVSTV